MISTYPALQIKIAKAGWFVLSKEMKTVELLNFSSTSITARCASKMKVNQNLLINIASPGHKLTAITAVISHKEASPNSENQYSYIIDFRLERLAEHARLLINNLLNLIETEYSSKEIAA